MSYQIIIGRNQKDREMFGDKATVYLGKLFVKMGETTSLSSKVYMDVARTHVVMIAGKRGSGKSYSSSVIAEEISMLPPEVKQNMSVLFFDTMGVFWTMKYPNTRQEKLLADWGLLPQKIDIRILTPEGFHHEYIKQGIPSDAAFTLRVSELTVDDWCQVFEETPTNAFGIALGRAIDTLKEERDLYSIRDIVGVIQKDTKISSETKIAAESRLLVADKWGLFSEEGTTIDDIMTPGGVTVLDISAYTSQAGDWNVKALVIGLISRKLLEERIKARKKEEMEEIREERSFFAEEKSNEKPMVWVIIDEAHEFLPREGTTPATDSLVQLLREGRQPGISLVLVTQQPGEIHKDVLTQSDIILSHRLTAQADVEALNSMMQSYLVTDLQTYLNNLPKEQGAAIILDDNSERIYPVGIHPKRSWHGGEAPSALKVKKELLPEI